jgi:hypothetical protein
MFIRADNLTFGRFLTPFLEGDAGTPAGGGTPDPTPPAAPESTPPAPEPSQPKTLAEFFQSRMAGNATEGETKPDAPTEGGAPKPDATPKAPEPQPLDVPDKFKNPDGSIKVDALVKSYTSMESMYGKQGQQMNELQQTVKALQQQIAQQAQTVNAQAPKEDQLTPEELQAQAEAEIEKFWEEYNENPREAIAKLVRDAMKTELEPITQKVAPIIEEKEQQARIDRWAEKVTAAKKDRPDFEAMVPAMKEIIAEYGDLITSREDAVEVAYNLAKAKQAQAAPAKPSTVEDLLKDPEVLQKLIQDPNIKNQVLAAHIQEIKNNPAPPVIGAGGVPPSTPPVDLKDMKTAKEALKAKYAGFNLQ